MKPICLLLLCSLAVFSAAAQQVNIVFDVTSPDTAVHAAAVRHVKLMSEAYPESNFEVVIYSGALPLVLKDKSTEADDVVKLADQENVTFKVCAMTLKKHQLEENSLLGGVGTVPDGIMEIVMKQQQGWAYIKEAN